MLYVVMYVSTQSLWNSLHASVRHVGNNDVPSRFIFFTEHAIFSVFVHLFTNFKFSSFEMSSEIMFLKILMHNILMLYSFVTHFQITKDMNFC